MLNKMETKKSIIFLVSAVILVACTLFGYNKWTASDNSDVTYIHSTFVTDLSDDRKLAGLANNVFIGKVISKAGDKKLDIIPETQFNVQVLENIKGSLKENIMVNQQGGYDSGNDKKLVLMENDKMIEPGKVYLFATRYNVDENWYTLIPEYGDKVLDNDTKKKEAVGKYKKAVNEQIEFNPTKLGEK